MLVPDRWREYGKWRAPQKPVEGDYEFEVGRVRWPWSGPAQWYLLWYPDLARTLREFRPDVIDVWEEPWSLVSAQTVWLCRRLLPQAKIIIETEQNIAKTLPPPFESFRSYTLRHADFVVGRSQEAVANTRAKGYEKRPPLPSRTPWTPTCSGPWTARPAAAPWACPGSWWATSGGWSRKRGWPKSWTPWPSARPMSTWCSWVRARTRRNWSARWRKRALPSASASCQRGLWRELPQVMNALDTLVLPSRTTPRWKEQFGRVIIEAQACERPVVGSASGAIPEVIGEAGLVFPERDAKALAGALLELPRGPGAGRRRWGASGVARWSSTTPGRAWPRGCARSTAACWRRSDLE